PRRWRLASRGRSLCKRSVHDSLGLLRIKHGIRSPGRVLARPARTAFSSQLGDSLQLEEDLYFAASFTGPVTSSSFACGSDHGVFVGSVILVIADLSSAIVTPTRGTAWCQWPSIHLSLRSSSGSGLQPHSTSAAAIDFARRAAPSSNDSFLAPPNITSCM